MRIFRVLFAFSFLIYPIVSDSAAAATQTIKNCVNIKTGVARYVSNKTTKCRSFEKLVVMALPVTKTTIATPIHYGLVPPTDITIGHDGDFYIDKSANQIYGPRDGGKWGKAINLTGATFVGDYGAFHDTSTVTLSINTATALPLNTTDLSSGITVVGGTNITFSHSGTYNIAFSSQIYKQDSGTDTISIWLRKNGANLAWSSTDLFVTGSQRLVAAWNFFVQAASGDYYQIMISSSGTDLKTQVISITPQTNPDRPGIPGTIVTVNQVG